MLSLASRSFIAATQNAHEILTKDDRLANAIVLEGVLFFDDVTYWEKYLYMDPLYNATLSELEIQNVFGTQTSCCGITVFPCHS